MNMKICSKCKKELPLTDFWKNSNSKDGLYPSCKECNKDRHIRYRIAHKKEITDYSKIYRGENKEIIITRKKEWYNRNIEKERLKSKTYRENHIDECKSASKKHYQNNKECYFKKNAKRQRELKFIPIMSNPFPKEVQVEYHHINNLLVIPIPKTTHRANLGNNHRMKMNLAILKIYGINLNKILGV